MRGELLRARVNTTVGCLLVGSLALAASLIIWNTAYGYNPLAKLLEERYAPIQQMLGQ